MPNTVSTQALSRHIAIFMLLCIGSSFASAHIAARISFDHGTGLLTAVAFRSGFSLVLLTAIVIWQKQSLIMTRAVAPWQLLLGLLIALQSISIYSAVSIIPVGIALLAANTFPAQLALISWALGGQPPSRRTSLIMVGILVGLLLALDIPSLWQSDIANIQTWIIGIALGLFAAFTFALGLWVTEHKLREVNGSTRTFYIMLTVFATALSVGSLDIMPNSLSWPADTLGWLMLLLLSTLYACGFVLLFSLAPRLNLAQNAPAMNIEPVASLSLGWIVLGQALSTMQIIGGALVVSCIIAFAYAKKN